MEGKGCWQFGQQRARLAYATGKEHAMRNAIVVTASLQHAAYLTPSGELQLVSLAAWVVLWCCAGSRK
jgi:hypothetical protein